MRLCITIEFGLGLVKDGAAEMARLAQILGVVVTAEANDQTWIALPNGSVESYYRDVAPAGEPQRTTWLPPALNKEEPK